MKQPLFIQDVPIDEKRISFIEKVVSRLVRRSRTTAVGVVTPFPISSYIYLPDIKVILRYMFPAAGTVTKGVLFIENMPKSGVNVTVTIHNSLGTSSRTYFTKRRDMLLEPNNPVFAGDRLIIEIESLVEEEIVTGIWIAFLWAPKMADSEVRQFLIDDLEKLEEAYAENQEE